LRVVHASSLGVLDIFGEKHHLVLNGVTACVSSKDFGMKMHEKVMKRCILRAESSDDSMDVCR